MSRTLILAIVIAVIGVGGYFYLNQSETTPSEQLDTAAQDAGDAMDEAASAVDGATSDVVDQATEQAGEAASSVADQASEAVEQAGETAADLANQAGEQVAALANQGQDLFNSWVQDGMLTAQQFDYDAMVASVQDSELTQELKTQAIQIIDDIQASPEMIVEKVQELRNLLTQQ